MDLIKFLCIILYMFIRSLLKYAFTRAASNPKVRAKAAKVAKDFAQEASKVAKDPDPARKLGRMVGKIKKKIINRDF